MEQEKITEDRYTVNDRVNLGRQTWENTKINKDKIQQFEDQPELMDKEDAK